MKRVVIYEKTVRKVGGDTGWTAYVEGDLRNVVTAKTLAAAMRIAHERFRE